MVLFNAHASTEDKEGEEKELFYAALEDAFDLCIRSVRLVVGGFNAKLAQKE